MDNLLYEIVIKGGDEVGRRIETVAKQLSEARKSAKGLSDELDKATEPNEVKRLTDEYKKQTATIVNLTAESQKLRRQQGDMVKEVVAGAGKAGRSYREMQLELTKLTNKYKDLSEAERKAATGMNLAGQVQRLNKELKDIDASMGNYQRNVGNYGGALKDMLSSSLLNNTGIAGQAVQMGASAGVAGVVVGGIVASFAGLMAMAPEAGRMQLELAKQATVLEGSLGKVQQRATEVASSMGLTNMEFASAAAELGDLLKPMGFTADAAADLSLAMLDNAAALSAWSGGKFTTKEVVESMGKALVGEMEELKRYGIVIQEATIKEALAREGKSKLTGEALRQAKAEVIVAEVTKQRADALRLYAMQSDSITGKSAQMKAALRTLKEDLITAFIPTITRLVSGLAEAGSMMSKFVKDTGMFQSGGGFLRGAVLGLNYLFDSEENYNKQKQGAMNLAEQERQERKRLQYLAEIARIRKDQNVDEIEAREIYKEKVMLAKRMLEQQGQQQKAEQGVAIASERTAKAKEAATKAAEREAQLGGAGSINRLSAMVSDLKEQANRAADGSEEMAKIVIQLADAEGKLEVAQNKLARMLGTAMLPEGATSTLAPLPTLSPDMDFLQSYFTQATQDLVAPQVAGEPVGVQNKTDEELKAEAERQRKIKEGAVESYIAARDAINEVSEAFAAVEIGRIERKYERELQLAAGNAEEIARIEKRKADEIEKVRRAEFERAKKIQTATATIQGIAGIVNLLATPSVIPDPFGSIYKAVQVAALAATTAAQIAKIQSATFAEGGYTGEGMHRDHTGHKVAGVVHDGEYVVPKRVLQTTGGQYLTNMLEQMRSGRTFAQGGMAGGSLDTSGMAAQIGEAVAARLNEQRVALYLNDFDQATERRVVVRQTASL
jgi:hypothetical protein